jgi:hypothetical protein
MRPDYVEAVIEYLGLGHNASPDRLLDHDVRKILAFEEEVRRSTTVPPDPKASIPLERSSSAEPGRQTIKAGSSGVSYERLFVPWISGTRELILTDLGWQASTS